MCFSVYILVSMLHKNFTEDEPEQILTPVVRLKYKHYDIHMFILKNHQSMEVNQTVESYGVV